MMRIRYVAPGLVLGIALAWGCVPQPSKGSEPTAARTTFVDVAHDAGITHRHQKPLLDRKLDNIMPWMASVGAAVAAADYDNDGWVDLYVTNSAKQSPNYLYRNNGDGTFSDVAERAGLARVNDDGGVSMDCIWADLNNDGLQDLYLVRWGRDLVFRNLGDGTFREVSGELLRHADGTPGAPWANGNAVIALDYDLDGRLDLYVGNYFTGVDLWHLEDTYIMHDSFETSRNAGRNFLYHQLADGTFEEVAGTLGVDDTGWTLAVGSADLNNDGWPDLYVANDFGPDQVFYNLGGTFENVTAAAIGPDTRKGMNVDFGDFNNDGWLDIYVTNITTAEYLQEGNMLWRNNGPGADGKTRFMDVSPEAGTYDGGWGWGAKFLDYDNDGDLDLLALNGFVSAGEGSYWYDLASWTVSSERPTDSRNWPPMGDRSFSGYEKSRFWRNEGFETFSEQAAQVGLDSDRDGRGIACLDYDNDGDIDLYVANQGHEPHLYRNDSPADRHWLGINLVATAAGTNLDAVGARVTLVAGGQRQIRERDGGVGFAGQSDRRLHFGLDRHDRVEWLEVRWPDGGIQVLEDLAVDRYLTVRQDSASYVEHSSLEVAQPTPRTDARHSPAPPVAEIDAAELDRLLVNLEDQLRRSPSNHQAATKYREYCARHGRHDRAIAFFEELLQQRPDDPWAALELSVAFVDKIPTCGGLAAIVCKGTLARKSLDVIDELAERRPDDWVVFYSRGMNHLHWPRALRHSPAAVDDFRRSLELRRRDTSTTDDGPLRLQILLGDAEAKNREFDAARRTWSAGLRAYPDSPELARRVALESDPEVAAFVDAERSLEKPIDTSFTFLAAPAP